MNIKKYIIRADKSIKQAMKQLDAGGIGFLCIYERSKMYGIVTDGDIRRAIINNISIEKKISEISNINFTSVNYDYQNNQIDNIFKNTKVKHIPVIKNNKLIDLITIENFYKIKSEKDKRIINASVVIMAGGKGTRLDPFTRILPKPLIPIGDKPMIEVIMDEYAKFGIKNFYVSINHKGKMVKAYFEDSNNDYKISYINEKKPLGTAGSLKFLENKFNSPFFVSNCDIIIKDDYIKFYDFHKKGGYALSLVASMQNHIVPYGVCEIEKGGILKSIHEKPQYDFLVNTGMYILNPEVLKYIPKNKLCHITYLIEILKKKGLKIGVYPVSEKSYLDIGQWDEYKKVTQLLG